VSNPESPRIFQGIGSLLITLWTLGVFTIAGSSSRQELENAMLQLGDARQGLRLALGVVLFLIVGAALNLLLGWGRFQDYHGRVLGIAVAESWYPLAVVVALGLSLTGIPLSGLAAVFGEEYGWRGFLQSELAPLGWRLSSLLVGLVWGLWHIPVILSGVHTYPPSLLGVFLGLFFFAVGFCSELCGPQVWKHLGGSFHSRSGEQPLCLPDQLSGAARKRSAVVRIRDLRVSHPVCNCSSYPA
jgi:membrane protease YdiL (CAAX protease family)